ncbi:MAG: ferrous iron transport protein B, partial [Candidatus Zixiibacteriota bacterium]
MKIITGKNPCHAGVIAICGNPNCGKTTIFNAITGLNQQVGNYPGVTVEKVTGQFSRSHNSSDKFTLLDIPGTYSLSAFTPDEYIAASALFGEFESETRPDVIITVIDATNLERGLYLLFQVMQIGCPVVVALNMIDMAKKNRLKINYNKLSKYLGNVPVVPVVGISGKGIDRLKEETAQLVGQIPDYSKHSYDDITENLLGELISRYGNTHHSRAQYIRIIFDEDGPAEKKFIKEEGKEAAHVIKKGREKIRNQFGSLVIAETKVLTNQSTQIYNEVVKIEKTDKLSFSAKVDKYLLHPVIGPLFLVLLMLLVFQSIFTWAEPFMAMIDTFFSSLAGIVSKSIAEGPLQSLLTDGLIGGVGSVLVFIPQIAILFIFIAILEDSGYMTRSAFLVDRMFRWCGLSGKSFIPLLSSFACAVPGIMATRTIEDRKLRFITIIVAPLMTCSARLPVYTIMIAAFIPYKMYFGFINLQGLVLA